MRVTMRPCTTYADSGRVVSNQNGAGGGHGFSGATVGAGAVVTVTDALGNATRHIALAMRPATRCAA